MADENGQQTAKEQHPLWPYFRRWMEGNEVTPYLDVGWEDWTWEAFLAGSEARHELTCDIFANKTEKK